MVDIRQTIQYANYLSKIGWKVERSAEINYFVKKLSLIGSVLKIQRPEEIRIDKIKRLSKKYKVFRVIIEPKDMLNFQLLTTNGFKLSKSPYLPSKTLHLDLTKTKEELSNNLKKDAKYALRKWQMTNVKCQMVENLEKFREVWKKAVGMKRYVPPPPHLKALKKSFKKNSLFITDEGGNSGGIFLIGDKIAYYWQAFSNKKARRALAQYKIVWEAILWAKERGAKIFDFEGIYDKRFPDKSWLGFTHFKKSFGGHEVEYPGAFVKSRFPL
jgi:lipid II:glycine glycyltransferase (peptidoglycan interpeptide bridge formation enzyme)